MPYKVVDKIVNNTETSYDSYENGFENVYRNNISADSWVPIFLEYGRELEISEANLEAVAQELTNLPPLTAEWNVEEQYAIRTREWSSKEIYDIITEIKNKISMDLDDGLVRATIIEEVEV